MYQQDPEDAQKTIYNAYLYKSPGFYKLIRQKAHHWGVETLCAIMMADRKIKEELIAKQQRIKENMINKRDIIKEKTTEAKE